MALSPQQFSRPDWQPSASGGTYRATGDGNELYTDPHKGKHYAEAFVDDEDSTGDHFGMHAEDQVGYRTQYRAQVAAEAVTMRSYDAGPDMSKSINKGARGRFAVSG